MAQKLAYTHKTYILFLCLLVFFFIGYRFSFSDTLDLYTAVNVNEDKLCWLKEKEKQLPALKVKMADFENAYVKNDSNSVRDQLTAYISDFAEKNNCLVTDIPSNSLFQNDNLYVQTNTFTIKGNYYNLVSLLYKLESQYRYISKIMSARFYSTRDAQTKRKDLYLTVITQSFEQRNK